MLFSDQVRVNATDKTADLTLVYRPISMGKLRLFMQVISSHIIIISLVFFGSERSPRDSNVCLSVCLSVCPHYAFKRVHKST